MLSLNVSKKPLLLSRDATVIQETRRVQDLWSSTPPGIPVDKDALKSGGPMSLIAQERFKKKPSPSSKPAGSHFPILLLLPLALDLPPETFQLKRQTTNS